MAGVSCCKVDQFSVLVVVVTSHLPRYSLPVTVLLEYISNLVYTCHTQNTVFAGVVTWSKLLIINYTQ